MKSEPAHDGEPTHKAADVDSDGAGGASKSKGKGLKQWLIRYGPIGVFLFFLIKGLIWLALAALAWWGLRGG